MTDFYYFKYLITGPLFSTEHTIHLHYDDNITSKFNRQKLTKSSENMTMHLLSLAGVYDFPIIERRRRGVNSSIYDWFYVKICITPSKRQAFRALTLIVLMCVHTLILIIFVFCNWIRKSILNWEYKLYFDFLTLQYRSFYGSYNAWSWIKPVLSKWEWGTSRRVWKI